MVTLRGITWDHPRGYQPLDASTEPYFQKKDVKVEWDRRSLKEFGDAPIDVLAERYDMLISRVLYELVGIPKDIAREACRLASHKLPIATRFLSRSHAYEGQ